MAIGASAVWECRTTGVDTSGGAYTSGGVDLSQQNAPQYSVTDGVTAGTTTITSATANFGTDVVGNVMYVSGGTGSVAAGWYQIASRTNSTTIVVDRSTGLTAGTGVTLHIGGALLSPAVAVASAVSNNTIWIKSGTYTVSTASTNVANGCISGTVASMRVEGYNASRGDLGTAPLLQVSGTLTASIVAWSNNQDTTIRNVSVDGIATGTVKGFAVNRGTFYKLTALNCTNNGFNGGANTSNFFFCKATGCSAQAAFASYQLCFGCEAYSNTNAGFGTGSTGAQCVFCIAHDNSGASSDGFIDTGSGTSFMNCTAYTNGRDGFRVSGNSITMVNCLAEANVGNGFSNTTANGSLINCGVYNNGTNFSLTAGTLSIGAITATSTFFTNAAGGDFSLNNVATGGALARAAGIPGAWPDGTTTGYPDIGAVQHPDPASMIRARVFTEF